MENRTLQQISVDEIAPNPHNPRLIFNREELDELKQSIDKVGILVPVTVYRNTRAFPKSSYILLDGERRWRCARELSMQSVPANVIDEPTDDTQNILFMFNIHHYRREWELFPTAIKLEALMEKLGTSESTLAAFTGVSRSTIRRCKALLWYPKKYRDILLEKNSKVSTDFFIELFPIVSRLSMEEEFRFPNGTIRVVDSLIDKFIKTTQITDVKDFREIRKSMAYFDEYGDFSVFKDLLNQFISSPDVELEIFMQSDLEADKHSKIILRYIVYLNEKLEKLSPDLVNDFVFLEQVKSLEKKLKALIEELE